MSFDIDPGPTTPLPQAKSSPIPFNSQKFVWD